MKNQTKSANRYPKKKEANANRASPVKEVWCSSQSVPSVWLTSYFKPTTLLSLILPYVI